MFTEAYAQSLSPDFDLDNWPSDMALARDNTPSCHKYLCQIIFVFHHAIQSNDSDTNRFH